MSKPKKQQYKFRIAPKNLDDMITYKIGYHRGEIRDIIEMINEDYANLELFLNTQFRNRYSEILEQISLLEFIRNLSNSPQPESEIIKYRDSCRKGTLESKVVREFIDEFMILKKQH